MVWAAIQNREAFVMSLLFSCSGGEISLFWNVSGSFSMLIINALHSDNNENIQFLFWVLLWAHFNPPIGAWAEMILSGTHENIYAHKRKQFCFIDSNNVLYSGLYTQLFWESSFLCFLTVIGGYNIYLRMSIGGECRRKNFVWGTIEKEVLNVFHTVL